MPPDLHGSSHPRGLFNKNSSGPGSISTPPWKTPATEGAPSGVHISRPRPGHHAHSHARPESPRLGLNPTLRVRALGLQAIKTSN